MKYGRTKHSIISGRELVSRGEEPEGTESEVDRDDDNSMPGNELVGWEGLGAAMSKVPVMNVEEDWEGRALNP